MFAIFNKKTPLPLTADKVSPGGFSVFLGDPKVTQMGKNGPDSTQMKLKYHIILVIFMFTLVTHSWAFFERHILKNAITPIVLLATGFFYDSVFAAAPEAKAAPAPAATPTAESKPAEKGTEKEKEKDKDKVFDPLSLDEGRVKILLSLHEREKDLKKWEEMLVSRETMVKALEVQVQKKSEELADLKRIIESLAKSHNEKVDKNIKNMVDIYESMKPQSAAKFFNELPLEVLIDLIQAMNPKKTSAIMSQMDVEKVKSITDRFALMPKVPENPVLKK